MMNKSKPFEEAIKSKIAERKMYFEEERERILEALSREFLNEPNIIKKIEKVILL